MPKRKSEPPLVQYDDMFDRLRDEVFLINTAWVIIHSNRDMSRMDAEVSEHLGELALRYQMFSQILGTAEAKLLGY